MTKDINHLSKISGKLDKSGLFSSSEAVDSLIKHVASKLKNDEYRTLTKKIRNRFAKNLKPVLKNAKSSMAHKLLAIAAQFDIEGNFEESDKLTETVKAMVKKKLSRAMASDLAGSTDNKDTCETCGEEFDLRHMSISDRKNCELTGCCKRCVDRGDYGNSLKDESLDEPNPYDVKSESLSQYEQKNGSFDFDRYLADHSDWPTVAETLGDAEWEGKDEIIYELPKELFDEWVNEQTDRDSNFNYEHAYYLRERYLAFKDDVESDFRDR